MGFAHGKRLLITGATDGIGRAAALDLADKGAHLVVHGRDQQRAQAVCATIQPNTAQTCEIALADFASLTAVRALANDVRHRFPDLRVLVNNAGIYARQYQRTEDGFELTFAVNHLATFLLTNLLLDVLVSNAPARIITVASTLHLGARLEPQLESDYDAYAAYNTSKLANVLFTYELAERLQGSGVVAHCLHPGGVNTKLMRAGFGSGGVSPAEGADSVIYLADDERIGSITGKYFAHRRETRVDARARDAHLRRAFWDASAKMVGLA